MPHDDASNFLDGGGYHRQRGLPFLQLVGLKGVSGPYPAAAAEPSTRPLGRVGDRRDDTGRTTVFLASHVGAFITGDTLPVDGGFAIIA